MHRRGDIFLHLLPSILVLLLVFNCGCTTDYTIMTRERVVEVEKVIEVPIYIEVEVPAEGEVQVDSFFQSHAVNGIDILWVIDTSGSMDDNHAELINGISAMMNALPPQGWRLAMIPADPNGALQSQQFPLVPGDDAVDAELMFMNMLTGPGEDGFDAVYHYVVENEYADTWMRWDAALLVVFVSDEEEQSSIHLPTVQDFIGWFAGIRPSVYLSSIINFPNENSFCDPPDHEVGYKYIEATQHFGGVTIDICSSDWAPGVAAASSLVEPVEELVLSKAPIESTIKVFIDGQMDIGWVYDQGLNKIVFSPIPAGGSLVEVGYIIDPNA